MLLMARFRLAENIWPEQFARDMEETVNLSADDNSSHAFWSIADADDETIDDVEHIEEIGANRDHNGW